MSEACCEGCETCCATAVWQSPLLDCMTIEAASALPLNNGNQTARSTATNFLKRRNMRIAWQNSALLSNRIGNTPRFPQANATENSQQELPAFVPPNVLTRDPATCAYCPVKPDADSPGPMRRCGTTRAAWHQRSGRISLRRSGRNR